jgi:hypothetical protein
MPMRWRFEHEDDGDARTVLSVNGAKGWADLSGPQCEYAVADAIESWCDDEPGAWSSGDMLKVVVLAPPNVAGVYHVSVQIRCSAVAYHQHPAET